MSRGALLVLVCACHSDPKPAAQEQSKQEALAILCVSSGVPERVTNKELRTVVDGFADKHPWELEKQILELARDAGLRDCHPLDALTRIRAHNIAVIDVGQTIALGGKVMTRDELRAALATPPDRVVIVAEPGLTMQTLAETIALAGGRAQLGRAGLPEVVPAPR